jgi:rhodanese-related sulfurtransferase
MRRALLVMAALYATMALSPIAASAGPAHSTQERAYAVQGVNVPLAEVRNMFAVLDRTREYVAYCQSGRRSAAAAFLFAQRGFKVWLLDGGMRSVQKSA